MDAKENTCNKIGFPRQTLKITVRNMAPSENILAGTLFQRVIFRGTYFIAHISTGSLFF
jgi:hypothetical protein